MTAVDTAPADGRLLDRPADLGRRRPVLTFLGVLAVVALALLAIGRSGVLAPQADLAYHRSEGDGMTSYVPIYTLTNEGWRPIEVAFVRGPAGARFAPFTLAGGDHHDLAVPIPCAGETVRPIAFEIRVRSTDTGLARTLWVDAADPLLCPP